jgi:hypothetical protein
MPGAEKHVTKGRLQDDHQPENWNVDEHCCSDSDIHGRGGAGAELTTLFKDYAQTIVAAASFFGGIISAINAVLHAIPSQTGPTGAAQFPLGPKT